MTGQPAIRTQFVVCVGATILAAITEVFLVGAVGSLVAELVGGAPTGGAAQVLLLVAASWCVCTGTAVWAGRSCGYGMSAALHDSLAAHLLRLPLEWFGPRRHGEVSQLFGPRVMSVMSIPAHLLVPSIRGVLVPLGLIALIGNIDVLTGLIALAWVPVLAAVQWWSVRRAAAGDADLARARANSADRVIEFVEGQRTVRPLPDVAHATRSVEASVAEVTDRTADQVESVLRVLGVFGLTVQLMLISVAGTGLLRATLGDPGAGVVLVLGTVSLAAALQTAASLAAKIRAALGSAAEVRAFLRRPALSEPDDPVITEPRGEILVDDLSIGADSSATVLSRVSFHAPAGSLTAVVGASGAGKSTLLKALARFVDPLEGRILIDGVDCRALGSSAVHERVAMVFQDVELFSGTLEQNIRLGRPGASADEFAAAVAGAGIEEMTGRLPNGIDTAVGENGVGLSGGERQRVSIARALLAQAPILLLDEPASSLDVHQQHIVDSTVAALRGRSTVVLVTHRLSSVRDADQILVLDRGRIVECGRHEELLNLDGAYTRLWHGHLAENRQPATIKENAP